MSDEAVFNVGREFKQRRVPRPIVENRSLKVRVFVEGIELTKLYSAVSGGRFPLNEPAMLDLTLECPNDDLLLTEDDLYTIHSARRGSGAGLGGDDPSQMVFSNPIKKAFMNRFALMKVPAHIQQFQAENAGVGRALRYDQQFDPYLYNYGINGSAVPLGANLRIFIEYNGVWYHYFTGAVASWSYTQTIEDHKFLTLRCMDVFYYLRRTCLISQSFGMYESTLFKDAIGILSQPGASPQADESSIGLGRIASAGMSTYKFNFNKRSFIDALAYAIFGDIDMNQTGDAKYGTVNAKHNLFYFSGDNQGEPVGTVRNLFASGLFNLNNVDIGIFGKNRDDMVKKINEKGWGNYIPSINDLTDWEELTDNMVDPSDLIELSALDANTTMGDKVLKGRELDSFTPEEIVDILGRNTRYDGIYASSAGSLKVLLPGSLSGSAYDVLWPESIEMPSVDVFKVTPRLEIFAAFVTHRTDFVFYTTPKGHILVEFPLIDNQSANCFGTLDEYGQPWRSYSKVDRTGAYSDQVNLDGLFSVASSAPNVGTLKVEIDNQPLMASNPFATQSSISYTLLTKIGVKMVTNDPIQGIIPMTVPAAQLKSDLILSRTNRRSYSGSVGMRFQPKSLLNRNVEFWDVGRAGVIVSVNSSFIKDSLPSYSYTISYIREWDGTYLQDGRRSYSVAFGELLTNLGIDYAAFFEEGMYRQRELERQIQDSNVGMPIMARGRPTGSAPYPMVHGNNPLGGVGHVSSPYHSWRQYYNHGQGGDHQGVDIAAPRGTPIQSTQSGRVTGIWNNSLNEGYGIEITNPDGSRQRYFHMESLPPVRLGDNVSAGDIIGGVGSTGHSTGNHLHYEWIDPNGAHRDPLAAGGTDGYEGRVDWKMPSVVSYEGDN